MKELDKNSLSYRFMEEYVRISATPTVLILSFFIIIVESSMPDDLQSDNIWISLYTSIGFGLCLGNLLACAGSANSEKRITGMYRMMHTQSLERNLESLRLLREATAIIDHIQSRCKCGIFTEAKQGADDEHTTEIFTEEVREADD